MNEKVTELTGYVKRGDMDAAIAKEGNDRREHVRRAEDRIDRLELKQRRIEDIVVGPKGDNGLASRVKILEGAMGRGERVLWMLLATCVGVAVKAWGA